MSYQDVADILGRRESRKVANNSYLARTFGHPDREGMQPPTDSIGYRLHNTYVVVWHHNGDIELNTGGWFTVTTKDRLNRCLRDYGEPHGYRVYSERGVWSLYLHGERVCGFADGITIRANGTVKGGVRIDKTNAANDRVRKLVKRYLDGLTPEVILRLANDGGGGDCFYCQFRQASEVKRVSMAGMSGLATSGSRDSMGPAVGDVLGSDHLMEHLKKRYYMVNLCFNALLHVRVGNPAFVWELAVSAARQGRTDSLLRRAISRYFREHLLRASY